MGAALGGTLAETLGWRWEFGTQVPVMLLCLGVSATAIPSNLGRQETESVWVAIKDFDVKGSLMLSSATTALILALVSLHNVLRR